MRKMGRESDNDEDDGDDEERNGFSRREIEGEIVGGVHEPR
jgi:hypothetical protein